jgi:hypothetical protein
MFTAVVASICSIVTALVGMAAWFTKTLIEKHIEQTVKHEYEERLENHKAELQKSAEQLKSELSNLAHERQLRFAHLHEKAAEVVAETYQRLWVVMGAFFTYVSIYENEAMGSKAERRKLLWESVKDFQDYFYPRRLFLPRSLADSIASLERKVIELTNQFMCGVEKSTDDDFSGEELKSRTATWVNVNEQLQKEAIPLYTALEDEFRKLLGVK